MNKSTRRQFIQTSAGVAAAAIAAPYVLGDEVKGANER
ncbi:MAG: twin-arginine translocation signal domain-containing protein, partial [Planctomycetaceae bacterium]|nr:twin-arginine translocation signal domain-containing protein [Planctomycetaceae bacterium]